MPIVEIDAKCDLDKIDDLFKKSIYRRLYAWGRKLEARKRHFTLFADAAAIHDAFYGGGSFPVRIVRPSTKRRKFQWKIKR